MVVKTKKYLKTNLFPTILYARQCLSFDGMPHFPLSLTLCFLLPVKAVDSIILPTSSFLFFSSSQWVMTYFPSASFRASLALCIFLKSRWSMLFLILFQSYHTVIIRVALIHCQIKAMEELLLGSVSTSTFFRTPEISQEV